MNDEIIEQLKEILRDSLTVQVSVEHNYYDGRYLKVRLLLDGEEISVGYDTLPTPSVSY